MGRRHVRDPGGRWWTVTRRWARPAGEAPSRRFRRRAGASFGRLGGIADLGRLGGFLGQLAEIPVVGVVFVVLALAVLAAAAVGLVVLVILPLLLAVLELVVLLVVAGLAVGARLVRRHPSTVVAEADDGTVHRWPVVGWRAAGRYRDEVADLLAAGVVPPGASGPSGEAPGVAAPGAPA